MEMFETLKCENLEMLSSLHCCRFDVSFISPSFFCCEGVEGGNLLFEIILMSV